MKKNMKNIYMYNWITTVQQKLAQNCKSTILKKITEDMHISNLLSLKYIGPLPSLQYSV